MTYEEILIVQHNVLAWTTERKHALANVYLKINPDVLLLNSTNVINNEEMKLYNYNIYKKNISNERNAGIAIAVRKNIKHRIDDNFNSDILSVKIETTKGPINICTFYQPPRRPYFPNQDLSRLIHSNIPTYFLGDLNARHAFLGHTTRTNAVGNTLYQHIQNRLLDHIGPDFNTMTDKIHSQNICRPDIVLINQRAFLNYEIKQGPIVPSDHVPIIMKISTKPIVKELINTVNIKKANWENFTNQMIEKVEDQNNEIDLQNNDRITKETLDNATIKWMEDIKKTVENNAPISRVRYHQHIPDSDFMNILTQHLKEYQENILLWNYNTPARIRYIQDLIIIEAKRMYKENWENKVKNLNKEYKNEPVKYWENFKKLIGQKRIEIPYLIDNNGEKVYEPVEQLNLLTETWEKTFRISEEDNEEFDIENEMIVNNFIRENTERLTPYDHPDINRLDNNNYLISEVTENDIIEIIKTFKNKAPGRSGINKQILVKLPIQAWTRLARIFNLALSMGYYIQINKEGILILPPKPGKDPKIPINRRPITLLEVPGKIFEKIINIRLRKYLEDNNKYYEHQHGFRKGRSTETALMMIYESIALNQRDKNRQCNLVCRDISKAFDKVWHNGLRYKILQLELPNLLEKLLSNYIENRKVWIKDNEGSLGNTIEIKSGVPQGGILSPTLFIIYTADMPETPPNVLNISYADDVTQVIIENDKGKQLLSRKTEREIKRLNEYESKWKIKTNRNKFQLLSISKLKPAKVRVDDNDINFNNEAKILGLTIKRSGICDHLKTKLREARQRKNILRRFENLEKNTRIHMYKAMVRPVFEYPITPTCIMSKTNKQKLQQFQNGNIREIYKLRRNLNPEDSDQEEEENRQTIQELHARHKIEPINVRLHRRAKGSWERFKNIYQELALRSENVETQENEDRNNDHFWWPRVGNYVQQPEPEPRY